MLQSHLLWGVLTVTLLFATDMNRPPNQARTKLLPQVFQNIEVKVIRAPNRRINQPPVRETGESIEARKNRAWQTFQKKRPEKFT